MLKLEPVSAKAFWLNLIPGVRIQFRPISVAAMLIARGAAGGALQAGGKQAAMEVAVLSEQTKKPRTAPDPGIPQATQRCRHSARAAVRRSLNVYLLTRV
jgi:hypothetical protein